MLGKCVNYLRVVSWWRVDILVAISFVAKWSGGRGDRIPVYLTALSQPLDMWSGRPDTFVHH